MKRMNLLARSVCLTAVLMGAVTGCRNSSGSLGKARLSILNVVSVEGEGISWGNRVPPPAVMGTPEER